MTPEKLVQKAHARDLVRAAGGVECGIGRVGKSLLSEYGRPDSEKFMPGDVQMDLEDASFGTAGWPILTRFYAKRLGFVLVAMPTRDLAPGVSLHGAIARSARAGNDLTTTMVEAIGDGIVDADEARAGIERCDAAAEEIMRLRALLEHIVEAG